MTGGMWEFKEKQRVSGKKSSSGLLVRQSALSSAVTHSKQDTTLTMPHHNKGLGHNEGHQEGLHNIFIPSTLTPYIDTVFNLDWIQSIKVNT